MRKIGFILMFFCFVSAFGQETISEKHPIDIAMEDCIAQDPTRSVEGVAHCEMAAFKAWKIEVNNNYEKLLGILDETEHDKLKISHKQWLVYADNEAFFARSVYSEKKGFPSGMVSLSRTIDIWRQRSTELKEYYDLICGNKM